jgi:4-deoxy-L-threo-5-hexosulose-uronate ketol-isomerase
MHFAAATSRYAFVWAMGGENQEFDDMQGVSLDAL